MNKIPSLKEVYDLHGIDFLRNLLENRVSIKAKVSGSRIELQKGDTLNFYNKGELSVVERTMISLYENPISILEKSSEGVNIPSRYRLGFRYINESGETRLTLTDIKVTNNSGKAFKDVVSNNATLSKWSRKLGVNYSKSLFEGYFSKDQISKILDIEESSNELFSNLLSIINKENGSPRELILRFVNESGKVTMIKTIDPDLESKKDEEDPKLIKSDRSASDMASISIMDMLEWMMINGFEKYQLTDENRDQRYLDLISLVFMDYVKSNKGKFEDVDFNKAEFSKLDEFKVNTKFIKPDELKTLLTNESYQDLFKIMLGTFRKVRKNPTAIIDRKIMEKVNNMVEIINKKVEVNEPIQEINDVPSFLEYKKSKENKIIL